MYFVNMISNKETKIDRGNSKIPFVCGAYDSPVQGFVTLRNNMLTVSDSGVNLFEKGISGNPDDMYAPIRKKKTQLTHKMIADTEENPLVIVLCSEIAIFDGVSAGLKYIYINEDTILACLIYGVCEFDGVPMQRCNTQVFENKKKKLFSGKDMKELSSCEDTETGYSYLKDVVNQVEISYKDSSTGESLVYRTSLDNVVMFDNTGLELAKQKKTEHDAKVKEIKERKEEEERKRVAEIQAKEDAKRKEEQEKVFNAASVGAAGFLRAVSEGAR